MKVYVKLYAGLVRHVAETTLTPWPRPLRSGTRLEIEMPDRRDGFQTGPSVGDLVAHLGLAGKSVKIIFVNGRTRTLDHHLSPGDEVGMFPPIGGG